MTSVESLWYMGRDRFAWKRQVFKTWIALFVQALVLYHLIAYAYIFAFFRQCRNCSGLGLQDLLVLAYIDLRMISINEPDNLSKWIKLLFLTLLYLFMLINLLRFAWAVRLTDVWTIHFWSLFNIYLQAVVRPRPLIHLPLNLLHLLRLTLETFQAIISFNGLLKFRQIDVLLAWKYICLGEASLRLDNFGLKVALVVIHLGLLS